MGQANHPNNSSNGRTSKPSAESLALALLKIAAAFRVNLSEGTIAVYAEYLGSVREDVLKLATDRVILEWQEPSKMPTIAFINDRLAAAWEEIRSRAPELPSGEVDDTTPEERAEFTRQMREQMRRLEKSKAL